MKNNKNNKTDKILVAIPTTTYILTQTVASIMNLKASHNYQLDFVFEANCLVYDAREKLLNQAIAEGYKYIFFGDSDMLFVPDTIFKMYNFLENTDFDAITAMCFKRIPPFQPCFYSKISISNKDISNIKPEFESPVRWIPGTILPIQGFGMACCLISVEKAKQIKPPRFFPMPNMGEDTTFCLRGRVECNMKFAVDTSIECGHIGQFPITSIHFLEYLKAWEGNENNKGKNIFVDHEERRL